MPSVREKVLLPVLLGAVVLALSLTAAVYDQVERARKKELEKSTSLMVQNQAEILRHRLTDLSRRSLSSIMNRETPEFQPPAENHPVLGYTVLTDAKPDQHTGPLLPAKTLARAREVARSHPQRPILGFPLPDQANLYMIIRPLGDQGLPRSLLLTLVHPDSLTKSKSVETGTDSSLRIANHRGEILHSNTAERTPLHQTANGRSVLVRQQGIQTYQGADGEQLEAFQWFSDLGIYLICSRAGSIHTDNRFPGMVVVSLLLAPGIILLTLLSLGLYNRYLGQPLGRIAHRFALTPGHSNRIDPADLLPAVRDLEHRIGEEREQNQRLRQELLRATDRKSGQLNAAREKLLRTAHEAGMASIATSVIHNVGNLLNSIVVSNELIRNHSLDEELERLKHINRMIHEGGTSPEEFFRSDPRAPATIEYFRALETTLTRSMDELKSETIRLRQNVESIRGVITSQQNYATGIRFEESSEPGQIIDDSLTLCEPQLAAAGITVEKVFEACPPVFLQKSKLVQILVNLIQNACEAMSDTPRRTRKLTIQLQNHESDIVIMLTDTGTGFAKESLENLFTLGFTTKEKGHGIGLHSCANYIAEMNGNIRVESPGIRRGATFILNLPIDQARKVSA